VARLVLSGIFVVAGLGKLGDPGGSRRTLADFGLSQVLAGPVGILLPIAEIAVAVALLPSASAWWGALGALVMLLVFIAGISLNLAQGRTADCRCFGQIHSAPADRKTLIRNGLLTVLAVFIVWRGQGNPGPSAVAWLATLTLPEIACLVIATAAVIISLIEGWILLHLLQQQGRFLIRIEALESNLVGSDDRNVTTVQKLEKGLPVGICAPTFQLPDINGVYVTLDSLRPNDRPLMLLFLDPACSPCNALMPEIARWQQEYSAHASFVVISRGHPEINRDRGSQFGVTNILLQQDREVAEAYQNFGTPAALIIRPDGLIGSTLAIGVEQIQGLVMEIVKVQAPR
jgi:uncharacterized membrane protein YphA (DoxX/SURF4 family)/thiol-disulfide isomerase/thioredoxin